jgi:hypothetical protein
MHNYDPSFNPKEEVPDVLTMMELRVKEAKAARARARRDNWILVFLLVLLAGVFYVVGQHEAAGAYERSIQRQYDLMQEEARKASEAMRSHLQREGLHVEEAGK